MTRERPSPLPIEAIAARHAELGELCALVEARTGIVVSDAKRALVAIRLAPRVRELGLPSLTAYAGLVARSEAELVRVVDVITTHETSFFRQPTQFAFLEEHVLPHWRAEAHAGRRPHAVRAWSAGCSTGEEPYSIAMVLRHGLPSRAGWSVEVLASDVSEAALRRARAGEYACDRGEQVPEPYRSAHMVAPPRPREGSWRASAELSQLVRFQRVNLHDEIYPVGRDYDLVFCRNVLIYFKPAARRAVVDRLLDHLAPDGYLFLGQAEGLLGSSGRVRRVAPTVYQALAPSHARASRRPPPRSALASVAPIARGRQPS